MAKRHHMHWLFMLCLISLIIMSAGSTITAVSLPGNYERFMELYSDIQSSTNGYFSAEGVPYYSRETLIVDQVDYGHLTTSDTLSFLTWLGAYHGAITGNWADYQKAWDIREKYLIPVPSAQPGVGNYSPNNPAPYIPDGGGPGDYPVTGVPNAPTGIDPIGNELYSAYGTRAIYRTHWLLDVDNWYGYGNLGDGISRCSYIDTYRRGPGETVWDTVPHPCWDNFRWGAGFNGGFVSLFYNMGAFTYTPQWHYTSKPAADARQIQASYWAYHWSGGEASRTSAISVYTAKAARLGDYLRYAMFDKYFRPIGVQNGTTPGTGYDSCHYLLSQSSSWSGAISGLWSWRTGNSHCRQANQNPVAAYTLSVVPAFSPKSANGRTNWNTSLQRQLEFYQYLQSAEGAIAGGVTNSWNGRYEVYPAGSSTFYKMAYAKVPAGNIPPEAGWFGDQAGAMERLMEYYYLTGDNMAKQVCDKWAVWAMAETRLNPDETYLIPETLSWSGSPNPWTGASTGNPNLHCTVSGYTSDPGVTAVYAKALIYYTKACAKWTGTVNQAAQAMAAKLLDQMWVLYRDSTGVACEETRADYFRFFDPVYIPANYNGINGQGAELGNGVTFIEMRPRYLSDPDFPIILNAYLSGVAPVMRYHRFWAQAEIAMANGLYHLFFNTKLATE